MRMRRSLGWIVGALIVVAGAGAGAFHMSRGPGLTAAGAPVTSGSVQGQTGGVRAEGRIITYPGERVQIGTELGGTIAKLHVREGQIVKRGDMLVEFDDSELRAALAEANASVHASNARAGFHVKEARRLEALSKSGAVAQRDVDQVRSQRNAAFGETAVALSSVKRIEASLAKTVLRAPIDGTVITCEAQEGETRPPGAQLLTIANLQRLRVEAEVDEFDIARVALGTPAVVSAEGFDQTWEGQVEEIPGALVPKGMRPQDPARPVDTRVLLVKIGLRGPTQLKLGQRVEVRILPVKADVAQSDGGAT